MKKLKIKKVSKKNNKTHKPNKNIRTVKKNKIDPLPIPFSDVNLDNFSEEYDIETDPIDSLRIKNKSIRKKENEPKIYWNSKTEESIKKYINSETDLDKNRVFENEIKFSLEKMVENIMNTFKFEYFETDKEDAKKECLSHLATNLHRFDPVQYSGKSFGYFSVMAKNFFILLNNSNHKKWKIHDQIDPYQTEEHKTPKDFVVESYSKNKADDVKEFLKLTIIFWEKNVEKIFQKSNDLKIANAIIDLLKFGDIDIYNKKYIYFCIKEMCNCKTQQLTKVINKMKKYHKIIHMEYISKGCLGNNIRPSSNLDIDEQEEDFESILTEGKSI